MSRNFPHSSTGRRAVVRVRRRRYRRLLLSSAYDRSIKRGFGSLSQHAFVVVSWCLAVDPRAAELRERLGQLLNAFKDAYGYDALPTMLFICLYVYVDFGVLCLFVVLRSESFNNYYATWPLDVRSRLEQLYFRS